MQPITARVHCGRLLPAREAQFGLLAAHLIKELCCCTAAAASKLTYVLTGFPDGGSTAQRPNVVLAGAGTPITGQAGKVSIHCYGVCAAVRRPGQHSKRLISNTQSS